MRPAATSCRSPCLRKIAPLQSLREKAQNRAVSAQQLNRSDPLSAKRQPPGSGFSMSACALNLINPRRVSVTPATVQPCVPPPARSSQRSLATHTSTNSSRLFAVIAGNFTRSSNGFPIRAPESQAPLLTSGRGCCSSNGANVSCGGSDRLRAPAQIPSQSRNELVSHLMQFVAHVNGFASNSPGLNDVPTGVLRGIFRGSSHRA